MSGRGEGDIPRGPAHPVRRLTQRATTIVHGLKFDRDGHLAVMEEPVSAHDR
ncbi:hypothetical protein ACQPZZ_36060 [Microbispora sp. CA-135349]|uniref:hypothetical protein n=1 Tax=Microbispora sp. CA-135349 TaxID=3239953 RepID=UPI003D93791A